MYAHWLQVLIIACVAMLACCTHSMARPLRPLQHMHCISCELRGEWICCCCPCYLVILLCVHRQGWGVIACLKGLGMCTAKSWNGWPSCGLLLLLFMLQCSSFSLWDRLKLSWHVAGLNLLTWKTLLLLVWMYLKSSLFPTYREGSFWVRIDWIASVKAR